MTVYECNMMEAAAGAERPGVRWEVGLAKGLAILGTILVAIGFFTPFIPARPPLGFGISCFGIALFGPMLGMFGGPIMAISILILAVPMWGPLVSMIVGGAALMKPGNTAIASAMKKASFWASGPSLALGVLLVFNGQVHDLFTLLGSGAFVALGAGGMMQMAAGLLMKRAS